MEGRESVLPASSLGAGDHGRGHGHLPDRLQQVADMIRLTAAPAALSQPSQAGKALNLQLTTATARSMMPMGT
jgi:hypothetical protein